MNNSKSKNELQTIVDEMSEYHLFQKDAFIQNADISKQVPSINEIIKIFKAVNDSHFNSYYAVKDAFYEIACEKIADGLSKKKATANAIVNKYKQITGKSDSDLHDLKKIIEERNIDVDVCYELFGFVMEEFG